MQTNPILVTLTLGTDPYQQGLPATLLRCGMLRRLLRLGPDLAVLDPGETGSLRVVKRFPEYKALNRLLWGLWRRLPHTRRSLLPVVASSWIADHLVSRYVQPSSIFHGWTGICLASLRAAKRQGATTLVENPMQHPRRWQREVLAECDRFGVEPRDCHAVLPTPLIHRMEREYELCDKIIVPSTVARRSFEQFGYSNKAIVVWPGVDNLLFSPLVEPRRPPLFRVCYVGRVELAKGVTYLLQAWKRLGLLRAELLLVGEIKPEMGSLLRSYSSADVRLVGVLPPEEVVGRYQESSVFVFPSVNEGFGLVVLEAMACGLPVIASDETGAADCVTEGKEGFVVPARNVDALAEAILWCYRHQDEAIAMGRAARTKVEQQFTLSLYEARQLACYRSLANKARGPLT